MLDTRSRPEFLALTGVRSATLDQRVKVGEAAFAFGVERRPHVNEYPVLDALATILASMLNRLCGLTLKQACNEMREHWERWLELVTKAERWREKYPTTDPMLCIAVAWLSLEEGQSQRRYRILFGEHDKITAAARSSYVCNYVSIARALSALRANAKQAGVELPKRLTVAKGEPGHEDWQHRINDYREAAGVRRAKTQPLAPA